jgi:sec-independent protein translocase protein TatA
MQEGEISVQRLGPGELIIILVIVMIIFGVGKLPQIGGALGKAIREFQKARTGDDDKALGENMQGENRELP